MILGYVILSETSQAQEDKCYTLSYMEAKEVDHIEVRD
jgi:hypothetical protein